MHQGNHAQLPGFGASKLDHRNNALHPDIKPEYGHRSIPVLHAGSSSMERGITDNPQGLPTPDPSHDGHQQQSKAPSADPTSAVGYVTQQEGRSATYSTSTSATPTSEYNLYSDSARSGSFSYGPTANHNGLHHNPVNHGGLQQHGPVSHGCANPPCDNLNCPNPACVNPGNNHPGSTVTMAPAPSNPPVPSPSPSYPPTHYQPFQGQPHGLPHGYHNPGASGMYAQPRPDWGATYAAQTSPGAMPSPHHHVFQQTQPPVPPANRQNQVYSFVPIPGAQQTKRPRRRWEDIERMYMCNHPLPGGGNCQKAYGTLNHLNAHVQMQHHGPKRTPEEFKEIRKEWKARKKEEENKRKQAEEQQRQAQAAAQPRPEPEPTQVSAPYPRSQLPLPPLGYQSQTYPTPTSVPDYGGNSAYPPYPYAQGPQGGQAGPSSHPLYPPSNGGQQN